MLSKRRSHSNQYLGITFTLSLVRKALRASHDPLAPANILRNLLILKGMNFTYTSTASILDQLRGTSVNNRETYPICCETYPICCYLLETGTILATNLYIYRATTITKTYSYHKNL